MYCLGRISIIMLVVSRICRDVICGLLPMQLPKLVMILIVTTCKHFRCKNTIITSRKNINSMLFDTINEYLYLRITYHLLLITRPSACLILCTIHLISYLILTYCLLQSSKSHIKYLLYSIG